MHSKFKRAPVNIPNDYPCLRMVVSDLRRTMQFFFCLCSYLKNKIFVHCQRKWKCILHDRDVWAYTGHNIHNNGHMF